MMKCCPICKSCDFKTVFNRLPQCDNGTVVQCSTCSHSYSLVVEPLNAELLYNDKVYQVVENRGSIFDRLLNWEYREVIGKIGSLRPLKGDLLDFGGGKGKFCHLAQEDGWSTKCVETAAGRAAYAKEVYHIDVVSDLYEEGQVFSGVTFDVITMFHVLEHLPYPKALLGNLLTSNLKPDGLAVIEVPNIESWQAALAKQNWLHLDVPRHAQHFSPHCLKQMLEEMNYKILATTFWSFHLGVLGMLDTLMKVLGYKGNIIFDLKNKRSPWLILQIALVLPLAFLLESVASIAGKGGVIRSFVVRDQPRSAS
jgi:2-polyprenyl-3-methyl-5-hydroxy-6-metoxy-1,4-benzoquinol methylase